MISRSCYAAQVDLGIAIALASQEAVSADPIGERRSAQLTLSRLAYANRPLRLPARLCREGAKS